MKREFHKKRTRILSLVLALALLCSLVPSTVYAAEPTYELVESWANADLTDTSKYATVNANLTLGNDETVGNYVAMKATNWGPTLTVTYSFDASKYTEPTVGFWLRQSGTSTGEVKLLSAGEAVGTLTFEPVAGEWIFVTLALTASADSIQFAPHPYGNPDIGSIYFGSKADVEKIPQAGDAQPYEVAESWTGADLTDTSKYATVNANLTLGNDETVGDYVAISATNWGPTLTVTYSFDASKYTEPTVGFWLRQSSTSTGEVKLLSAGEAVGTLTFEPVAEEWIFVTLALTASADSIQFAPHPYGNPDIGSIYFGGKADVEKIPEGVGTTDPEPTDPEPTDPTEPTEPEEPGTPGGQGRWVLVDNFEGGRISSKYSVNEHYEVVASDIGNYSAYNDGQGGYLKYDKDLPAADYETPAIAFWAKGTEGASLMFWGNNPIGSVTLHEEWTYYVFTSGLQGLINKYGTGDLDYIYLWSAQGTEVWLDQIYFGEAEDLAVAPDQAEDYDFYQIIPGDEPGPEYVSSDKVVIHAEEGFESGTIPEGAETTTDQGAILWEIYTNDRLFEEYYDMLATTWGDYCLTVREDPESEFYAEGQWNVGYLVMPPYEVTEEDPVTQAAITFAYMTKYNRDESVNHWQILPEQYQNLTLEVSATGETWTEIWNLNKDMGDDLYNGCWYSVSVPVDMKLLSQGKLHYRFKYESKGGNQLALDKILVEEYIAPIANEDLDVSAYKIYDYDSGGTYGFMNFNTGDLQSLTCSDAPATYNGMRYTSMEYYNGVIYAVVQYENKLVALDPYTFEVVEVIADRIGSETSNIDVYGLTYDPSRDVFFVYQEVQIAMPADFELYEMDPDTGECTLILHWNTDEAPSFSDIACDKNGNLYGVDQEGLYKFDFDTLSWNKVEEWNLNINGPWVSALSINKETGILYYAPFCGYYNYGFSHLYAIDPNTARATKLGTVGNCTEFAAIVIPYETGIVERHTITSTAGENGTIMPAGEIKVRQGKNRTFTCNPAVGYAVDTLTVDGVAIDLDNDPNWDGFNNKYTFPNVSVDHTIEVTFKVATFTVTFLDHDGSVLDTQTVAFGQSATAPAVPEREGHTFAGWDTDFSEVLNDLTVKANYFVNTYQVIFLDWDGTILDVQKVRYQRAAEAPEPPVRAGYTFSGWDADFTCVVEDLVITAQYTEGGDPNCDHSYVAGSPVYMGEHTVAITYTCACGERYTETQTIDCPSAKFTDLTAEWYHEAVDEALYRGLFVGVSDTLFQPNAGMTRGQFVTVLYRMAGSPAVTGETPFTDVAEESWYADAVAWAYEEGLVKGVSDTTFSPNAAMSREMVVTILWRMEGEQTSDQSLSAFGDADTVSDYARTAMAWAVEHGLIQGVSETALAPGASITRAQGAVLLVRYVNADRE